MDGIRSGLGEIRTNLREVHSRLEEIRGDLDKIQDTANDHTEMLQEILNRLSIPE
ncbi:hypothetical protein [Nocardia sp. NPDC020380]|uniref:hypothetical protein n=1 Tax=Nocardia sp. NPDC020380 TaxID=3364309 RepID=UPI0037BD6AFB